MPKTLRLILGDQLNAAHSWFEKVDDDVIYLMMEMRQETDYVKHHVQKVIAFFAAMRSFCKDREAEGHRFHYLKLDDPNNQQVGPTFENIPIIGEENRFYMNIGVQLSLYNEERSNLYVSLFGNISDVELRRNYIVINNRDYEITHPNPDNPGQRLGGTALGGGSGLGFKFGLSDHILADLYYNIYYASSNFNDDFKDHAVQHSIGLRLLWN